MRPLFKEDCRVLYVSRDKYPINNRDRRKVPKARSSGQPTARTINIIIGGVESEGDSNNGQKQYARQYTLASKTTHDNLKDIAFRSKDLEGISFPRYNALVILAIMANFEVRRILADNESATNILSREVFAKMEISAKQLKAVKTPLWGFGDGFIIPKTNVKLPPTLGSNQRRVTEITSFQVIRASMAYNTILGRPLLNKIKAIMSTFYLAMKFATSNGIRA